VTLIAGLDPGSLQLGYGIIEARGSRLATVAHGTLCARRSEPLPQRLARLYEELCAVLDRHGPTELAVEKVFTARNPAAAMTLGQARGMILLACGQRGLPLAEYAPAEIKKAVTGNGRAGKEQVAAMVGRLLQLPVADLTSDATDALAVAVCHAAALRLRQSLARSARS
jgi:crossover junction endodeoxyribonuclease RuvC